jgi:hypothetical protein
VDCTEVEPFVSIIYDGEEAPLEAVQHFMNCASCRARMQDYSRITSEMRILAAEGQRLHAVKVPSLQPRSDWRHAWSKSVRIPRVAAVVFLLALAAATVGWVHTAAQNKETLAFWCDIQTPISKGGSPIEAGGPDTEIGFNGDEGFAYKVEALSISDHLVVLRIRFKYFSKRIDSDQIRKELDSVTPQEITYIPGQQISIPVEGGAPVLLSGHVVRSRWPEPVGAAALLPAPDEMAVSSPVLIRDEREVLAAGNAVILDQGKVYGVGEAMMRQRCESPQCGVALYVPKHGLFFFSIRPLDNSIEGGSGMSHLWFVEDGHTYLLSSAVPLTGGDQPRRVWVVHLKDYLPSQNRGLDKSRDEMASVGMGDLSGYLAPPMRKDALPKH